MHPQVHSYSSSPRRFRRAPSRCQIVWQAILILATLALAVAANAQSTCSDVFAGQQAPLRSGDTVTIHYSYSRAHTDVFSNLETANEILTSSLREQSRFEKQAAEFQTELQGLANTKKQSKATFRKMSELAKQLAETQRKLPQILAIKQLAERRSRLSQQDLSDLTSHEFEQTVRLKSKADEQLLQRRLGQLLEHLAVYDPIKYPGGRIARTYRYAVDFAKKRKILTFVLIAIAGSGINQGYQLYASAQADANRGSVTQTYEAGLGNSAVAPANAPSEAIGN